MVVLNLSMSDMLRTQLKMEIKIWFHSGAKVCLAWVLHMNMYNTPDPSRLHTVPVRWSEMVKMQLLWFVS